MEQFSDVPNHGRHFLNLFYIIEYVNTVCIGEYYSFVEQYFYYSQLIAPFDATIDIDIKNVNFP